MAAGLRLTRLLHHLDEHFSGLRRIPYFACECDARSFHSILGLQADVKAEAIDCSHVRLLCLNASKPFREQLDEAIRVLEQAVEVTPPDSPELAGRLSNLGNGLRDRFGRTMRAADFERALQVYRLACERGASSQPQAVLDAARSWGGWALQRKEWAEAAAAYGYGLSTGQRLLVHQLLRGHKEDWLRQLQEMSNAAAYGLTKLNRYDEAAMTMERGRSRLLAEALQRRRRDLEQLPARGHGQLYERYYEIVQTQEQLIQPESNGRGQPEALRGQGRLKAIEAAAHDFEQVVSDIRQVPGYADFLAEASFAQIQAAASSTPVVYLLSTTAGGLALIVSGIGIKSLWLDSLTDSMVRKWLAVKSDGAAMGGWLGAYSNWLIKQTPQAQHAWLEEIDKVTHQLWIHLMQPLGAALHQLKLVEGSSVSPSVTLIPTGLFALLPLHAAWTEDATTPTGRRYFLDDFTVRYAPSAVAFAHARERSESASAERLLAVEEPRATGALPLPNVHSEVTAISGLFNRPLILMDDKATREAVLEALTRADVVHFSCHGSNAWLSPLDSGMLMADDASGKNVMLTVRDLMNSKLPGGRLATLSACETGIVGGDLLDEAVALPSALLQAGYGGVVASLWSVSDISTAILMEHFYVGWRKDKLTPGQALRAAQCWLRDTTNKEKAEYFQRYSKDLSKLRMPEGTAIDFYNQVMSRDLDSRDFAHPFWWAGFYMTGV